LHEYQLAERYGHVDTDGSDSGNSNARGYGQFAEHAGISHGSLEDQLVRIPDDLEYGRNADYHEAARGLRDHI
jgi:hypothetical protein